MSLLHFFSDCSVLCILAAVDEIRLIDTDDRTVRRNDNDPHVIDFKKFLFFCLGCTCHACKPVIETEEVLIGDRGNGHRLLLDFTSFLGFYGLMQSV